MTLGERILANEGTAFARVPVHSCYFNQATYIYETPPRHIPVCTIRGRSGTSTLKYPHTESASG